MWSCVGVFSVEVSGHSLKISLMCFTVFSPGRPRTSGSNRASRGEGAKGKYSHSGNTTELCFLSENWLSPYTYIFKKIFREIS